MTESIPMETWEGEQMEVKVLYSRPGVAQHIWVEDGSGALLFDAGDGVLRDLLSTELDLELLKAVIITHGHFDHVGGLHSLLGYLRMVGREAALPILLPRGTIEVTGIVRGFIGFYRETIPFDIAIRELDPYETLDIADFSVKAYPVVHCGGVAGHEVMDQIPAFGYRVSCAGETVAITGDSGMCPSLGNLVRNADLALIEATFGDARGVSQEELEKVHLSERDARELGALAKAYILVHRGV